ncbi:MAG: hypothetical protein Q4F83_01900 [Eubacteriales bacterium]|nr:hypothetical protein [Eubacteriales bacterium]
MSKMMKKLPQMLMLLLMALVFIPGVKTDAATVPFTYPKHVYAEYRKNNEVRIDVTLKKAYQKYHYTEKYTNVKVKNTKIAVASKNGDHASMLYYGPYLKLKKTGTTKVTFDVKLGNSDKVYHCSTTLHVYKYKKPIKKLTIGGKNVASKIKLSYYDCRNLSYDYKLKSNSQNLKVKVTPASGWKVTKIMQGADPQRAKKVKNGGTVKVRNGSEWLTVTLKHSKTKVVKTLNISFYR